MSKQPLPEPWLPMESAPKDGQLVRLLVQFEENAIDDGDEPFATIGQNNFQNDQVDRWQFVGWNWTHDEFTDGLGTPLGWLPMLEEQSTAARDVLAERQRQITAEGWAPDHDDEHDGGELAAAGAAYALHAADHLNPHSQGDGGDEAPDCWPWHDGIAGRGEGPEKTKPAWWKPGAPRRNLIKAGALILAEIERLDRLQLGSPEGLKQPQQGGDQ